MEERLLAAFSSDLKVSDEKNDTSAPHPRLGQYKSKTSGTDGQEYRRIQMMERQKRRRFDALNYSRKLVDGKLTADELDVSMDVVGEEKETEKRFNPFKNQLMLSEWLVEVPPDLEEEWLMTVCPVGKRCLIVANRGTTSVYTKSGFCINRFPSLLPGGSRKTVKPGEYSILDCVYNEGERTFYVIDLTCWKGHPVYDSETEFRFYWLKTKFEDEKELSTRSRVNPYIFKPAPCCSCKISDIQQAVAFSYSFKIDGLLFYHKRTHYTPGRTPLVGWLKPSMLPDVLGIRVPTFITDSVPIVNKLSFMKSTASALPLSEALSVSNGKTRNDVSDQLDME
ncbi:snurportin-1-like [Rhopilema esculentum]|uniref:snurportin-1-like n=1 Tax=Rhopilema esculentum TaxID=499914 RepID=UPI0031D08B0D|eukprot:gene6245-11658_t